MDLQKLGRETARGLIPKGNYSGKQAAKKIRCALKRFEDARLHLGDKRWANLPPAVEWLLDNAYLAKREGAFAQEELKRGKYLRARSGECYVQQIARGFVGNSHKAQKEQLEEYLLGVQAEQSLTEEELSLFIPALKGELCCRLAELCPVLEKTPEKPELAEELEQLFGSLRTLSNTNYGPLLDAVSPVEQILAQDPAGAYQNMDESTRARYRHQVCLLARRYHMGEKETAEKALELAKGAEKRERHVGWFLFQQPLGMQGSRSSGTIYVALILIPTLFLALLLGYMLESWTLFFLLLLPASDLMKNLTDFFAVHLVRPRMIPRMELKDGLPSEGRTLCVIAGLLTGSESGRDYAGLLERYRLANRDSGEALYFGLLADIPDRASPMGDEQRRWVKSAENAIEALNQKYGGGFYLFFRQPMFQKRDERYVGWERKRGALIELARLLRGKSTTLQIKAGNPKGLSGTRYVITLDSDTALNVGTARELVGAMLHPLNQPQVDPRRRVVTAGYGLLQPRVGVELNGANRSQFSRIFAGQGGIDPYGGACSDVYHDLFDRGTYTGKGIFDIDAFLQCLDGRFPEERILSHDLLEGAYLHAGLLADVELTDGYPYKVSSYFSRLHRWVRGDWQLLPWLRRKVKNQRGEQVENPISSVDKWKIFDNLRRSLSPVFTLVALLLGMCLSAPAFGAAAALAIISAWSKLLLTGADLAFRGGVGIRRRYHATIIAGPGGMILQTLVQLLFLPYQAWVCASAILTALWRSIISHKKMLEWVTAADTERKKDGLGGNFRIQWPAVAIGIFAMAFARFPAGAAVGLVWTVSPAFAWAMSRPMEKGKSADGEDRPFLLHQGGLIWKYFQDWLRPEDHWLPPDNVQEKPWLGPARRTSPTNIGMALLSCVAAADLELTGRNKAVEIIAHMLDAIEALPKWNGHLYNWYDTSDCTPLHPRYISTVDSGNLRGCLIALREALYEWGEGELGRRAEVLSNAMDLSPLYDEERKLFTIGFDVERGEYTAGWYDLMASEARLASYLAAALGEVDPRHWRRLSRGLVGENDYCGMASWTGTMFEYFMPNLLLPCEPGSLMYESLSFCIYAQKRRGGRTGRPWGISESGFYAFDPGKAYQYKAHGVQALGLKRGLDKELVVAPYASFLALLLAPRSAGRNLRRLRDMGLEGRYGLYEAVDFTPARLPEGEQWAVIQSYMAHHLGMSLVAIDNSLNGDMMQKRFLRDCSMSAFRELLQEKVPVGAPIMKANRQTGIERPRPVRQSLLCREGKGCDLAHPACHLLSNGVVNALCTDGGAVALTDDRGETPIATCFRERYAPAGVSFFCRDKSGKVFPLTAEPLWGAGEFGWRFDGGGASWITKQTDITATVRLTLPNGERGALWTVELDGIDQGELLCYLEPVLAKESDYKAHPAYSKLSLESSAVEQGIAFLRRPRSGERKAALAVVWDREEAAWDTSREQALGRGGLRRLEKGAADLPKKTVGAVIDPCLLVRFPLHGRNKHRLRLALGFEDGKEQAERTALAVLHAPDQTMGRLDGLIRELQLSGGEIQKSMELLSNLAFPDKRKRAIPQSALWVYGISGDLPIVVSRPPEKEDPNGALLLKAHQLLTRCGYAFDLVYLLSDGGDYRSPQKSELTEMVKSLGLEGMLGKKGGIHLVEQGEPENESLWNDWAAVIVDAAGQWKDQRKAPAQSPAFPISGKKKGLQWHFSDGGEFTLQIDGGLPDLGWSQLLVNPRFGWLTDETGRGHLWSGNARECPITPWNNDSLAIGGPEWFLISDQGKEYSLFSDEDACPVTVTYGFGWARWEKQLPGGKVCTTALVPWDQDRRLLLIESPDKGTKQLKHINAGKEKVLYNFSDAICLSTDSDGTQCVAAAQFSTLMQNTVNQWKKMCLSLRIETPDPALNGYLNGWCLYQVIACRLLGRTSAYQNGGAYGFRDQLQDTLALLPLAPVWVREQILRCCTHQFLEGDVQHWWHEVGEEKNRGVRTRISDDLLWLPYALIRYVNTSGDWDLLSVETNYLSGDPLNEGEKERYFIPAETAETEDVYSHALRAIRCVLERGTGIHGLLKIGGGDWNDGMNEVGEKGQGESVWLTWFAIAVLDGFLPLAAHRGDAAAETLCRNWAEQLRGAAENAWDGRWYLRGWYDNGQPLGSNSSQECKIDSIAQSWAVLSGGERGQEALCAALEKLFDRKAGIVKLFAPAFDNGDENPGYIKGYLPGVRENGGQYTHAAVWLALACFQAGWIDDGYELIRALLPATHPQDVYKAEPYVLAGDVYSNPDHLGRGGWSWYTGAAGWYYQAAVSGLLGISVKDNCLTVVPRLPSGWTGWSACWDTGEGVLRITVKKGDFTQMYLDGTPVQNILLTELKGEHRLEVMAGEAEK